MRKDWKMEKVTVKLEKRIIPTYTEPAKEELPMFAENRVHQRSSGRPYPCKVTLKVNREEKIDREYEVVILENEYIKVEILPEIGGRIYSALDKTTGYDFFYKQHVIKPALIGVLGSWISGGVEFNWPFHHRASGFMPCDFYIEELQDGSAICHLSEHDPLDRMKGMVSIILRPGEKIFETRVRLYNRTSAPHSFLWWENAAVPVHEKYQIFFPQDVTYVNFHYLKSRTTYPMAGNGIYNGIPMEEERDISFHKNTEAATSYFASASSYDFFGGYDHAKECGVVHIGDHHVSPGKKMFTWGYCQLARSWENALTDSDGQYAELMAGSYSDNQPNFSWLEPYETKEFSQYWYPISGTGTPEFANLRLAFNIQRGEGCILKVQSTGTYKDTVITLREGDETLFETVCTLRPDVCSEFELGDLPKYVTLEAVCGGRRIAFYEEKKFDEYNMPEVITDMPSAAEMNDAGELYLAGVHVDQYRDPAVQPDAYWKKALERDINHVPSLIAMAGYELSMYSYDSAESYARRAIDCLSRFNTRHKSGEAYYICGRILEAKGDISGAIDHYNKAAYAADSVAKAMTRIAMLEIRLGDTESAARHASAALSYGKGNSLASAVLYIATGNPAVAEEALALDPLSHILRYLVKKSDFYSIMDSNPFESCLDICFDLSAMGMYGEAADILRGLDANEPMYYYTLGYFSTLLGEDAGELYLKGDSAPMGDTYPVRPEEMDILRAVIAEIGSERAKMLLGCLLYNKRHYSEAAALWEQCGDIISLRNLAVAYFSHLGREDEALELMERALALSGGDEQLIYETAVLMDKLGSRPEDKIKLLTSRPITRDDCFTELAKAYNQAFEPEKALGVLLGRSFVPCEGGEHAIADQYLFAHLVMGRRYFDEGLTEKALETLREGQLLPQSLGAGLWNHCKLVPLKYCEALCLERLGRTDEAREIFEYISTIGIEYFSNMHLKELPYYQCLAMRHLGTDIKAQHLMTKYRREWSKIIDTEDNGFFSTTPFFISFTDDPKKLRRAQHSYLMALADSVMGNDESAAKRMALSGSLVSDNLTALFFSTLGFLK